MAKVRVDLDEYYIWTPIDKGSRRTAHEREIEVTDLEAARLRRAKKELDWMADFLKEKVGDA